MALLWPLAGRRGRADVMGMAEGDGDGTGSCRRGQTRRAVFPVPCPSLRDHDSEGLVGAGC